MSWTKQKASLIEEMVFRSPEGMEGWRAFRIEYGGHAEACLFTGSIWLPPTVDPDAVEALINNAIGGETRDD